MDLLDFARGPALVFALAVFVLGTLWRLVRGAAPAAHARPVAGARRRAVRT